MLRWIVESSQRLRLLVVLLALGIMAVGAWQLPKAPKEVLPEFAPVYVEVQTEALGLSAEETENLVTIPIEQLLLNGVAWIDDIHSESVSGLSSVVLIFEPGTDPLRARQMVAERLTRTKLLPNVSKPPQMLQPLSSASRVMMVRLSSTELSAIDVSVLARWNIRPALMGVPGVANVSIWGQRDQQLQVQVDPVLLDAAGVTLQQVIATTGNSLWVSPLTYLKASAPGSGGFIDTPQQRLGIQHLSPITSPAALAKVPIEGCDLATRATCPTLGDVATIVEGHQPLIGDAIGADTGGVLLVIEKFPDANTADVTSGVEAMLQQLQPGLTGVIVDPGIFNRAGLISSLVDNTVQGLIIGMILALLLLALFLVDWRSMLICAITLPLSLTVAALILHLRGATFDMVVIAGLIVAVGVIIDDIVVDVDHISRRLSEQRLAGDTRSTAAIVTDATLEIRSPMLAATVIILVAAIPVIFLGGLFESFFLDGQSRAFTEPMVRSYALAILASVAVTLIITPALASVVLGRFQGARRTSPLVTWLHRQYGRALDLTIGHVGLAAAAMLILLALGLALMPQLREPDSIVPASQDRDLLISWEAMPGVSLTEMQRITARASAELRTLPGVRNVGAHVGRALTSDQIVNVNSGELWVSIDPGMNYDKAVASIDDVISGYPGINHTIHTYLDDRVQAIAATDRDVVLRIYGTDPAGLLASGNEVLGIMGGIAGVTDARVETAAVGPEFHIEVNLEKAQAYGLTPGDVRRTAATLVTGLEVGSLFEDQKVFEVVVQGLPSLRESQTSIENLMISAPIGGLVRLGDIATVAIVPAAEVIRHDAVSRYVDVTANVSGREIDAVVTDLKRGLAGISFPLETHAEVLGSASDEHVAWRSLLYAVLAMLAAVFLILQASFSAWRLAAMYAAALPGTLAGGLAAAFVFDRDASLGVLIGLLAVFAIAVRHGMMLIHHAMRLEAHNGNVLSASLVHRAAQDRLAPIVMTTLATALALAPFAVRSPVPGLEILHPLAVIVLGGLITSTVVNLFIVPSLYLHFAPSASVKPINQPHSLGVPAFGTPAD